MTEGRPALVSHSFTEEWRTMPGLHKLSVGVSIVFLLWIVLECCFFILYVAARWGFGLTYG